jgi:hypothetical protein
MSRQKTSPNFRDIALSDRRIYRLMITLRDTDPPIWRRLEVYAAIEMDSLASAIDSVFGWSGEHPAEFKIKGRAIGDHGGWTFHDPHRFEAKLQELLKLMKSGASQEQKQDPQMSLFGSIASKPKVEEDVPEAYERDVPTLSDLVPRVRTKFTYTNEWTHLIEVEKIAPADPSGRCPRCTHGARANPIEDCWPWDFADFVEAAGNPDHERFAELEEWGMAKWDPTEFSIEKTNRALAKLFRLKKRGP